MNGQTSTGKRSGTYTAKRDFSGKRKAKYIEFDV